MSRFANLARFIAAAGLVYALLFAGLLLRDGAPIVLALPLVVYLASALLRRPPVVNLSAERVISADTVRQNTPVEVTLRITNHGPDLDEVLIDDRLPNGMLLLEGQTRLIASLAHDETLEMRYTLRPPRGMYYLQDVTVTAGDHLGLLQRRELLPARARILALPEFSRLRTVAVRPPRTHGHFGSIPSRRAGTGVDFFGLRTYQPGDPRRWINWRASARHEQQIFVNQFEQERLADVGIILDARQQSNISLPDGSSLFEHSVLAAGSLAGALLDAGNRVGLLVYGFGVERTFPGYGKIQHKRILQALGSARTGHNFALESLGYLPTRLFPAGSQIVMVSPLLPTDAPAFMRLRACGYEVLVVSPDPVEYEARALGVLGDLPWRIARVERALILRRLQRMGVRVLDWQVSRPFEPLVRASLNRAVFRPQPPRRLA